MKGKLIKQKGIGFQTIDGSDYFLTIDEKVYHTNPLTAGLVDGGKLSYKNCQAIERGYDLDELADFYSKSTLFVSNEVPTEKQIEDAEHISEIAFKEGFRKALELMGGKKFSEEDMSKAWSEGYHRRVDEINGNELRYFDKLIQSLQHVEWDVEIEMVPAMSNNGNVYYGDIPKKDEYGCLILKRI